MRSLRVALVFLTRLPVRVDGPIGPGDLAEAAPLFPLVGALVGLAGGLVFFAASLLNLPTLPAALLAVAAQVCLTGALHEDGLADAADGLGGGGGRTRDDMLRIMRDSRLGSYGAIALVLALLARLSAIAAGPGDPLFVTAMLVAAGAASRAALAAAMAALPPARADGLAASAGRPGGPGVALALGLAALTAVVILPPAAGLAGLAGAALAAALAHAAIGRRLGGHTGDTLGAVQQVSEVGLLFGVLAAL